MLSLSSTRLIARKVYPAKPGNVYISFPVFPPTLPKLFLLLNFLAGTSKLPKTETWTLSLSFLSPSPPRFGAITHEIHSINIHWNNEYIETRFHTIWSCYLDFPFVTLDFRILINTFWCNTNIQIIAPSYFLMRWISLS